MSRVQKISLLSLLVGAAGVILPLYETKENRVAEGIPVFLTDLPILWALLLLLPLVLLSVIIILKDDHLRFRVLWLATLLGGAAVIFAAAGISQAHQQQLPDSGRIGMTLGLPLLALSLMIPWFGLTFSRRRTLITTGALLLLLVGGIVLGSFDFWGIVKEAENQGARLGVETANHIRITFVSVGIASLLGILGAFLSLRYRIWRSILFSVVNLMQTIPTIALFGLLIAPLAFLGSTFPLLREWGIRGIGDAPAIIALSLYALFPILRNTYAAIDGVSEQVIDAARGLGMSRRQLARQVVLPSAAPVMLYGIRLATVQTLGNAVLAKLIGAGGLGVFIFEGLGQYSVDMVLLGMVLVAGLTVGLDGLLRLAIWLSTPRALRMRYTEGGTHD